MVTVTGLLLPPLGSLRTFCVQPLVERRPLGTDTPGVAGGQACTITQASCSLADATNARLDRLPPPLQMLGCWLLVTHIYPLLERTALG